MPIRKLKLRTREMSARRFEQIVLAALGLGFVMLLLVTVVAVGAIRQNQVNGERVRHTYMVIREVAAYRALIEQGEAARRGLLLTGQSRFLTNYRNALSRADGRLDSLAALTTDNPIQVAHVARLRKIDALQRELFGDAIAQVAAGRRPIAAREFGLTSSPELMAALRDTTQAVADEENRLLNIRDGERARSAVIVYVAFLVTGVVLILVGAGSFWVIRLYTRALQDSRDRLARLNEGLEDAVVARTADLTRANDEIQRFAYIVSHDLRSPLVNVMGFTSELDAATVPLRQLVAAARDKAPDILTAQAEAAVDEDLPEAIGFIRTSTKKMDGLINAILRLSREGRRILSPEALDMNAVAEAALDGVRHRADERGMTLAVDGALPALQSDRVAIEQVLGNLVDNAVKYARPGGGGHVAIRGYAQAGRVILEVQDDGRGIDPKDHERIFELFRRSGRQDQPGEGIGLAHVRALVYRLGGIITCDSTLDQGATFRVSLPPKLVTDPAP